MYCVPARVNVWGVRVCGEMVGGWMDGKERGRVNESKKDEGEGRGRGGQRKGREKQQSRITGLEVSYL